MPFEGEQLWWLYSGKDNHGLPGSILDWDKFSPTP